MYLSAHLQMRKRYFTLPVRKGHEGVKGTVTEDFRGFWYTIKEITFYRYGSAHQNALRM